jgi:acetaldehyde dehydrogenase
MVTCGGQASIPLLKYIKNKLNDAFIYTEVVTQINSKTAGIATRINIDKYIDTTEKAIYKFINIPKCKVILNINPNIETVMQTTIFIKTHKLIDISIFDDLYNFINRIQTYIPNYSISNPVWRENNIIMFNIKVLGSNFLSKNAGNLDIINCAAVHALTTIYNSNI